MKKLTGLCIIRLYVARDKCNVHSALLCRPVLSELASISVRLHHCPLSIVLYKITNVSDLSIDLISPSSSWVCPQRLCGKSIILAGMSILIGCFLYKVTL